MAIVKGLVRNTTKQRDQKIKRNGIGPNTFWPHRQYTTSPIRLCPRCCATMRTSATNTLRTLPWNQVIVSRYRLVTLRSTGTLNQALREPWSGLEILSSIKVSQSCFKRSSCCANVVVLERNDGGHYAAAEDPEGMVEDVRTLAAQQWQNAAA